MIYIHCLRLCLYKVYTVCYVYIYTVNTVWYVYIYTVWAVYYIYISIHILSTYVYSMLCLLSIYIQYALSAMSTIYTVCAVCYVYNIYSIHCLLGLQYKQYRLCAMSTIYTVYLSTGSIWIYSTLSAMSISINIQYTLSDIFHIYSIGLRCLVYTLERKCCKRIFHVSTLFLYRALNSLLTQRSRSAHRQTQRKTSSVTVEM